MVRRGDKREPILDAALLAFNERGFHGTSVPELARRAGVAAGTIYRYFDSKEELVNALYQRWKGELTARVLEAVAGRTSWRARFRALWFALAAFHQEHPGVLQFLELHHHGGYLDATSQQMEEQAAAALFALIDGGREDEVFAELEPAALIAVVYGAFVGLLRGEQRGYFTLTPELLSATEERAWAAIRR